MTIYGLDFTSRPTERKTMISGHKLERPTHDVLERLAHQLLRHADRALALCDGSGTVGLELGFGL
jgi:hypothetical protein